MLKEKGNFEQILTQFLNEFGQLLSVSYNYYDRKYIIETSTHMFMYILADDDKQMYELVQSWNVFLRSERNTSFSATAFNEFRKYYLHCIKAYLQSNKLEYDPMFELHLISSSFDRIKGL